MIARFKTESLSYRRGEMRVFGSKSKRKNELLLLEYYMNFSLYANCAVILLVFHYPDVSQECD